ICIQQFRRHTSYVGLPLSVFSCAGAPFSLRFASFVWVWLNGRVPGSWVIFRLDSNASFCRGTAPAMPSRVTIPPASSDPRSYTLFAPTLPPALMPEEQKIRSINFPIDLPVNSSIPLKKVLEKCAPKLKT
ncbi:unnamed protein product, partial [Scytosiphon promiscuus]